MPMFIPKSKRLLPVQPKPKPKPKVSRAPGSIIPGQASTSRPAASSPRPPRVSPPAEEMKMDPNEPYEDFKIFTPSTADLASGRKYNLFKFESRKPVSPTVWPRPVRLNRKDPSGREEDEDFGKLTPMLGLDGKPVIGADGNMVMLGPDGRPALQHSRPKQTDQPQPSKKKPFQRKTRQVYTIPEELRQLRKEERFPWVMEDGTGNEVWNARLDEISKSDNHGFLVPREMEAGAFVFFPSHRFYKLAKKSKRRHMGAEEVEEEMNRLSKSRANNSWLKRPVKQEVKNISLGPGGRRLKAVDSGQKTKFEQDDEFGTDMLAKARAREMGREGDADEMEFEDDFADDEEGGAMDAMDEDEVKELEERIKKEYRAAEKAEEPSDDDDDDLNQLTGAGKNMKKLFKRLDKGVMEESDKEDNPYKSSDDESSEEEVTLMEIGPQMQPQQTKKPLNGEQPSTPRPLSKPSTPALPPPQGSTVPTGSRADSPIPHGSDTPGYGASLIAKRATSPKAPRQRPTSPIHSRATSPLANGAGGGSRAASPGRSAMNSRAGSPGLSMQTTTNSNGKRRADDTDGGVTGGAPSPDATSPGGTSINGRVPKKARIGGKSAPAGRVTEEMIIEWIMSTENPTSKECINRFRPYIKEEGPKNEFTAMIKKLVTLKEGRMVLKPIYAGGGGTSPSTPAA